MSDIEDQYRDWDAAYVLGALSFEERKEYESHLSQCESCSSSLTLLAGIPGILGKIDSQTALALMQSEELATENSTVEDSAFIKKLAARAAKAQQASRIRQSLVAAAAILVFTSLGVAGGALLHSSGEVSPSTAPASATSWHLTNLQPQIMSAALEISGKKWGTHFSWDCTYSKVAASWPESTRYNLIITDSSGRKTIVASWSPSGGAAKGLSATTALPVSRIKMIEVTVTGSAAPIIVGVKA